MIIHRVQEFDAKKEVPGIHRDDHYIFAIQEKGASYVTVDFTPLHVQGSAMMYILPGQVHHGFLVQDVAGWFIAVDTHLLTEEYRNVFETCLLTQHLFLTPALQQEIISCLQLLYKQYQQPEHTPFRKQIIHSLLHSVVGIIAAGFLEQEAANERSHTRPILITRQFKASLLKQYATQKSPAAYAKAMHLSLSYLNECVKSVTGFSVTYWIQHEVMLEAKRLLYYTEMNIKQIAFTLGYNDHAYFSRLFTKATGISALQFRKQYRE
ncbi:transcriptional regulator, AraC family [Filimonas lacunae]|nr:transcriptional regulator, AraC family [Filimonas lacunae]